jgi:type IV pilus assembly protein PilB
VFYEGKGCIDCNNTGYKGRQGAFEVMPVTPAIRDLILDRAPTSELLTVARSEGMMTMREDALMKLKKGLTTAEEVLKETAAQ